MFARANEIQPLHDPVTLLAKMGVAIRDPE